MGDPATRRARLSSSAPVRTIAGSSDMLGSAAPGEPQTDAHEHRESGFAAARRRAPRRGGAAALPGWHPTLARESMPGLARVVDGRAVGRIDRANAGDVICLQ